MMQQGGAAPPATAHMALPPADQSQQMLVEEASPISSRPPAITGTLDELMRLSDAGDEAGLTSGNRWPRQETLALIQIRSDMDAAFRDATVKGPLWEEVSRKLAALGYKRSAKKCKEKFENVHKYYKRTKEGRAGRQDGKSYRFFSQLEALHTSTTTAKVVSSASQPTAATTTTLDVAPVSIGIPMPVSSIRIPSSTSTLPPDFTPTVAPAVSLPQQPPAGISFSSSSDGLSSSASFDDDDDDDEEEEEVAPSNTAGSSRKRKRRSSKGGGTRRMIEFFEGLMKRVMEKQEAMQQRFLEALEKREHDRMIREEAWKRQEMARLAREHELMTQERAISASRDASIIAFLQKITGQTIQLPSPVTVPAVPQPQTSPAPPPPHPVPLTSTVTATLSQQQPQPQPPQQPQPDPVPPQQQSKMHQVHSHYQSSVPPEITMGVPEQEVPPHEMGTEPISSRWPKAEVLALIQLRSGLESKYLDSGPKGPLWEEISAGMQQIGYKRNAKRCKEKWENINKYFKKVKESNKKRPEDSKTCPYFHELDALYKKKSRPEEAQQHQKESMASDPVIPTLTKPGNSSDAPVAQPSGLESQHTKAGVGSQAGSSFGEGNGAAGKKPEDIVKEFIKLQGVQQQQLMIQMEEGDQDSDNLGHEDDKGDSDDDYDDDDDDDDDNDRKMAYKIEFQRQNTNASNGGRNGVPSFLAIVQ